VSNSNTGTPPDKPVGNGGMPGRNSSSSNVSHTGATEISSDTTKSGESYSSTTGSENALLVTGGTFTLTNPSITKSGNSDGDNSDFYGTNAAGLVKEGTLNISGGTVTTNGSHANGVFAYSNGTINNENTAKSLKITLDSSSSITLTGDSYSTALENADSSNSNINFNGYKLYVNGTAIN